MDDLTELERRLALVARWDAKRATETALGNDLCDDEVRLLLIEVAESYDSAAVNLGGDPAVDLHAASRT